MTGACVATTPYRHGQTFGRPSTYDPATAAFVVDLYAQGRSLRDIAPLVHMTHVGLIGWRHAHPDFATALAHAREAKAEVMTEDGLALLDAVDCDVGHGIGSARVSKASQQANYRLALARCLDPATYGDKVRVDGALAVAAVIAFVDAAGVAPRASASHAVTTDKPPPQPSAYDDDVASDLDGEAGKPAKA